MLQVIQSLYVRFLREVLLCPAVHDKLRLFVLLTSAYELLDLVLEKRFQIATLDAQAFLRDNFFRNEARVQVRGSLHAHTTMLSPFSSIHA